MQGKSEHSNVVAKWHDPKTGQTKFEKVQTGSKGPLRTIQEHFKDQADAKSGAKAEATKLNRKGASGSFTQYGRVDASAEVDVFAFGFGPAENGKWRAKAVEHTFSKSDGFKTTIEVETPESGRS